MFWKATCSWLCVSILSKFCGLPESEHPIGLPTLLGSKFCKIWLYPNLTIDIIIVIRSRSIPLTNPFSEVANRPFTYRPSIQWPSEEPPAIHQLKSCNYRAVRPKPLPPPPISPFFRREPVRWLLMADSVAGRPNYVKHRLLLVMSPWQVTGRAGQFSSNNTLNIKLDPMEMISFLW